MTINYAIGRNSTEGRTHTMCIEGTHGIVVGMGAMVMSPACTLHGYEQPDKCGLELAQALGLAQLTPMFAFAYRL